MPQVSVIIPTYKHRDFVLQTLDSVFAQTFKDYEIIVVNDGSPDDTAEMLRPLGESGRIQYIEQTNAGQAAARNRGLSLAKGEFIAFLDDDDLWPADKLQWQVDLLRQHLPAVAVGGACEIVDASGRGIWRYPIKNQSISFESLFDGSPFFSPGQTLIRTDALRKIGGFDSSLKGTDDFNLWFALAKKSPILGRDVVSLYYREHAGNASANLRMMLRNSRKVVNQHLRNLPGGERRHLRRRADWSLYKYLGPRFVIQLKTHWKSHQFGAATGSLFDTAYFLAHLARTPKAAMAMMGDLVPKSWRRQPKPIL